MVRIIQQRQQNRQAKGKTKLKTAGGIFIVCKEILSQYSFSQFTFFFLIIFFLSLMKGKERGNEKEEIGESGEERDKEKIEAK